MNDPDTIRGSGDGQPPTPRKTCALDEHPVKTLLALGVSLNKPLPSEAYAYPQIQPVKSWV
jgi:hypothetical protein